MNHHYPQALVELLVVDSGDDAARQAEPLATAHSHAKLTSAVQDVLAA